MRYSQSRLPTQRESRVQIFGLVAERHSVWVHSKVWEVYGFNVSEGGGRGAEVIVSEGRQEIVGGEGRRTFKGGSGTFGQPEYLVVEGRGDSSVGPEGLGVEPPREPGVGG